MMREFVVDFSVEQCDHGPVTVIVACGCYNYIKLQPPLCYKKVKINTNYTIIN